MGLAMMTDRCGVCRSFDPQFAAEADSPDLGTVGYCRRARMDGNDTPDTTTLAWVACGQLCDESATGELFVSEYFGCIQWQPIRTDAGAPDG
jgi:hypothetical protein